MRVQRLVDDRERLGDERRDGERRLCERVHVVGDLLGIEAHVDERRQRALGTTRKAGSQGEEDGSSDEHAHTLTVQKISS